MVTPAARYGPRCGVSLTVCDPECASEGDGDALVPLLQPPQRGLQEVTVSRGVGVLQTSHRSTIPVAANMRQLPFRL